MTDAVPDRQPGAVGRQWRKAAVRLSCPVLDAVSPTAFDPRPNGPDLHGFGRLLVVRQTKCGQQAVAAVLRSIGAGR